MTRRMIILVDFEKAIAAGGDGVVVLVEEGGGRTQGVWPVAADDCVRLEVSPRTGDVVS
jgi:hypothetical protein